jgi:hypothetical protein
MKVLLDESVPRALGFELSEHFVRSVQTMGWAGLSNGRLLAKMVEEGFQTLVTCDQNIEYQQGGTLPVALIVLLAADNRVPTLRRLLTELGAAIAAAKAGDIVRIAPPR